MKKIVVFGGSGFVGSHVADHLSDAGYEVIIYDEVISPFLRNDQKMIVGDLLDLESVINVIKGAEAVFNFAALADLNEALNDPLSSIKINVLGNAHILEGCKIHKVSRFIYASSIYANSREGGFYGCSKKSAEAFIEEYYKMYGLNFTILRYGSLYGPRATSGNGLQKIVKKALQDKVLSYEGNEESTREYIHVKDASIASVKALEEKFKNKKIILTGQQPIKVIDLLRMLSEIIGLPRSAIKFSNADYEGHYVLTPYHYEPQLAEKYIPDTHVDLGEGLLEIIENIKDN